MWRWFGKGNTFSTKENIGDGIIKIMGKKFKVDKQRKIKFKY